MESSPPKGKTSLFWLLLLIPLLSWIPFAMVLGLLFSLKEALVVNDEAMIYTVIGLLVGAPALSILFYPLYLLCLLLYLPVMLRSPLPEGGALTKPVYFLPIGLATLIMMAAITINILDNSSLTLQNLKMGLYFTFCAIYVGYINVAIIRYLWRWRAR